MMNINSADAGRPEEHARVRGMCQQTQAELVVQVRQLRYEQNHVADFTTLFDRTATDRAVLSTMVSLAICPFPPAACLTIRNVAVPSC